MFGFFNSYKKECLVEEEMRQWIESSMLWLEKEFGGMSGRKILKPTVEDFPIKFNGTIAPVHTAVEIVAAQMDINIDDIEIEIYQEGLNEIDTGSLTGTRMFLGQEKEEKMSAGLYFGKNKHGKYAIGIEQKKLNEPESIVATMAHEFAHIKLLGESRIQENNEPLTDLTTIAFGLGIFNANASFQFKTGYDSWGYSGLGYLKQVEWAYALAIFAYIRKEKSPEWLNYLSPSIKADFKRSEAFIYHNENKLFLKSEI